MADDSVEKAAKPSVPEQQRPLSPGSANWNIMSSLGPAPEFNLAVPGMTFGEIGQSGLRAFAGWVHEEYLQELRGRQGAQKYREMGDGSPVIGAILYAIQATMRKVEWRTIPVNDSGNAQAMADFVDSCREDMSHTWEDLVIENLSMLQYGYAPHEIVYKQRHGKNPPKNEDGTLPASSKFNDGAIGWRRIPLRGQDTVLKWFFDPYGQPTGMTQLPYTGSIKDMPIEKMLLFRASQRKNNPEGRSILRSAYTPYYFTKRLQELEAILGERMGGVPVVSIPAAMIEAAASGDSKSAASLAAFKNLAVNLRIDEQMGVVLPSDVWQSATGPTGHRMFSLELVTPTGGRGGSMNFEAAITRYATNMMTAVLADFLTLGHEARGTQSLAVTKVDMFFQAVEGFLNANAGVYNRFAVPRLWELNNLPEALMPKIEPDLAQRVDLDVLSNFVLRLSQAGMPMFPNEELQTFLLDAGGLPDVSDPRALQAAGMMDEQLDSKDEMQQTQLDAAKNPPEPAARSPIEKMILASLARRAVRQAGPRFGIKSGIYKRKRKGKPAHDMPRLL